MQLFGRLRNGMLVLGAISDQFLADDRVLGHTIIVTSVEHIHLWIEVKNGLFLLNLCHESTIGLVLDLLLN